MFRVLGIYNFGLQLNIGIGRVTGLIFLFAYQQKINRINAYWYIQYSCNDAIFVFGIGSVYLLA